MIAATLVACGSSGDGGTNIGVPPLEITTSTSGASLDSNGYSATVDAGTAIAIGDNDTVIVGDAGAGNHVVGLSGLASNCQLQGPANDTVAVTDGSTAHAGFSITCDSVAPPAIPPPPTSATPITTWTMIAQPNNALLFDTWGSGPTDFFAAGTDQNNANAGVIDHSDGSSWVEQTRLSQIQLDAVWGSAPDNVYAVGGHND